MSSERRSTSVSRLVLLITMTTAWGMHGPAPQAWGATRVPLTVVERAGVARVAEPVTQGIPLPKGHVLDVSRVRLTDGEREVPAQFRPIGFWRPEGSIRWLLVDVAVDVAAGQSRAYTLEYGDDVSGVAEPVNRVEIDEDSDAYTVRTGVATFVISKRSFTLFDEVRLADGETMVALPTAGGLPRGALLRDVQATVTRAIPSTENRGKSHLIHARCGSAPRLEDYTLKFVTARRFELTGATTGAVGQGEFGKDFISEDRAVSIPSDAWLVNKVPVAGDQFTFRTIPEGKSFLSEGVFESLVLEPGPLRSVIRVKGSFGPTTAPVMEYTAWYHLHAGSSSVKLAFTLENNNFGGRTDTGNADNLKIGGVNCVFFDEMTLVLPVCSTDTKKEVVVGLDAQGKPFRGLLEEPWTIYQDSSGGVRWNRYQGGQYHPRPNSSVSFRGCRIYRESAQAGQCPRALGWVDVSDASGGVTVAVSDFWQNYPKSLAVAPPGLVQVGLFPRHHAADFPFRSGEHKTHEVLFHFHRGLADQDGNKAVAVAFSDPLRLEPSALWHSITRAIGNVYPKSPALFPRYEFRNATVVGERLDGTRYTPSVFSQREFHEFHGWMDYGDFPIDFEQPSGQWGMKYDLDYHIGCQYARSLHPKWWSLFRAAAKHQADIDVHHQPHYPGLHFVKGGNWAHSMHDDKGIDNPHRNLNHFTKDLAFGARGTAAYHYLTGDWKARDACLEVCENAMAEYMSPQKHPGPPEANNRAGDRGDACTLNRLLEGYEMTGQERFLQRARWQIADCAFDGKPLRKQRIQPWSTLFYVMALSRYVEMFPDDRDARAYLEAHLDTLLKTSRPNAGLLYAINVAPDGTVENVGKVSNIGLYDVMAADGLAFGYLLTRRPEYLAAARAAFATGTQHACWKNGPPGYSMIHCANGAMHGNLYMALEAAIQAGQKPTHATQRIPSRDR